MKKKNICILAAVALVSGGAMADTIAVGNAGFESPATADDVWLEDDGAPWSGENGMNSWSRIYDVASPSRQGSDYVHTAHNGTQVMQSGKQYHSYQKLAQTYVEGWTYTFSVWAAQGTYDIGRLYIYLADGTNLAGKDAWSSAYSLAYTRIDMAAGADWAQYSVSYTATATDAGKPIGINIYGSYYGSCVDDVSLIEAPKYEAWVADYGLSGGDAAMTNDYDGDGLNNLGEFGLGGDPTNALNQGHSISSEVEGDWMNYIYPKRLHSGLSYHLETTADLTSGAWVDDDYEVTGTNTTFADGFHAVSNRVSVETEDRGFIHLVIGEDSIIRVLVWNILHAGNDVEEGPEKILALIRRTGADICLLQESYDIDGDRPKAGAWLAGELGWNQFQGASSHLCVLTHFPILEEYFYTSSHGVGARLDLGEGREVVAYSTWIDYHNTIWWYLHNDPNISDEDLLKCETELSDRYVQTQGIIGHLNAQGHLGGTLPVLVGGDWNSPSHLDWTEEAEAAMPLSRRALPLPSSLEMENVAGFADSFRAVHPDPLAVSGNTWSPMYQTYPRNRIDRLYVKNPASGFTLVPVAAKVLPEEDEYEDNSIPTDQRVFPSDHAAVLLTFRIVEVE